MKAKTISELHTALRAAILDKKLERTRTIKFYFDAEVVIRTILGFRQFTDSHRRPTDLSADNMVLRALLSSGYLGRIYLLFPHALELDYFVRSQDEVLHEGRQGDFSLDVRRFLEQYHVADKFAELLEAAERAGKSNRAEDIGHILAAIKDFDVSSFVAVELANGTLQERLINLRKAGVLGFDRHDSSIDSAMQDPRVDDYADIISQHKPEDKRALRRKSTFNDALALAQLWSKVQSSSGGGSSEPLVRFYTEAEALSRSFKERRISQELVYQDSHRPAPVLRPAYYFLLRTYFRAISFTHLRSVFGDDDSITIEDLDEFCAELEELPEDRKIEQWSSGNIKNERLIKPLRNLESLAFFQGIWPFYKLPVGLAGFVDSLRNMAVLFREGRISRQVQARISKEMSGLQAKLSRNTQELRELFELLEIIEPKVEELREHWAHPIPTAMIDVGLIRWGFIVSPRAEDNFSGRLRSLLQGKDPAWRVACRAVVDEVRNNSCDLDRVTVVCAILWFLEKHPLVVSFISAVENGCPGEAPIELHVMRAAARLRAEVLSRDQRQQLIEDVKSRIEGLPAEQRVRYLIGLAYILAHAASFEEKLFRAEDLDDVAREWLRQSFSLGSDVAQVTRNEQSLLRAFAVNHCAYVGTVVADDKIVDIAKAKQCMTELQAMEASQPGVWNFRFVDTVLMPDYLEAKDTLRYLREGSLDDDKIEAEVRRIQDLVKQALDAYSRSAAYPDSEIKAHRRRWEDLEKDAKEIRRNRALQKRAGTIALNGGLPL